MSIWDNFVEDFNVAFHRKPGKRAEVVGPASRDYVPSPSYVENLDTVPVRRTKAATKKAPRRANYDGMSFDDAFAAAKRAGKSTFNWHGKPYTTQIDEGPTLPYIEVEPFTIEHLDHPDLSVVNDALAVQSDGSNALNKVANPYLGMRLPIQAQAIRGYGYGGCILPDIILY